MQVAHPRVGRGLDSKAKPGRGSASRGIKTQRPPHWAGALADPRPPAPPAARTVTPHSARSGHFPVSPCLLTPQPQSPSLRLSEACSATCDSSSSGFARPSLTSSNRNKLLPVPGTPFGCGTRRGLSVPQEAACAAWLHLLKAWDVSRAGTGLPSSPCTHLPNPKPKLWTISG